MAASWQKVHYLPGFQCPSRAASAGKTRLICQQMVVYVCNGSEFVYLYDKEEKRLKAIYEFPGKVWHIEVAFQQAQLFALCTENGVYSVSEKKHESSICKSYPKDSPLLGRHKRALNEVDGETSSGSHAPVVYKVCSEDCVIPDITICTFMVASDFMVTVSKLSDRWIIKKIQIFQDQDVKYRFIGEVEFPVMPKSRVESATKASSFLPFLCFVTARTTAAPEEALDNDSSFVVEASLFRLLFGIDAAMLRSPMILCAFPDGRLCCIPLKAVPICINESITHEEVKCPSFTQMILCHLQQPVVYIGPLRPQRPAADSDQQGETSSGSTCDCIVALGYQGKFVIITLDVKDGTKVLVFKEYTLGGSIISGFSCLDSLYYSTSCNMFCIRISLDDVKSQSMPFVFPENLNICSATAMTQSSRKSGGFGELLALSARGRLIVTSLNRSPTDGDHRPKRPPTMGKEKGHEITELLSRIAAVSDRVSWLKCAIGQKNKSLSRLNQVVNMSCAVLASQNSKQLVGCLVSAFWSRLLLKDSLTVSCCLENLTDYSLEHGWTLCIHVSTSNFSSTADSPSSAAVYNFPVNKLLPGQKAEVTFPLPSGQKGSLDLPVNVSCMLFYSLAGVTGNDMGSTNSQGPQRSPYVHGPTGDAVCLHLKEHVIDVLQCLRIRSGKEQEVSPAVLQTWSLPFDPVETFLNTSMKPPEQNFQFETKMQHDTLSIEQTSYSSSLVASVRLSLELLKKALKEECGGRSLCCAVLHWLLSDVAWVDTLEAQKLSGVVCTAPDGSNVRLLVSEVTLNDLCVEGPVPAVEVKMESCSTAVLASVHEAVLRRVENLLTRDAPRSGRPGLQVKHLQQMLTKNEVLLKEVQSLRDQLCLGKDPNSSAAMERLLNIYRELRNPSLIVL